MTLLKIYDRAAQKAKYRGEVFPSDQPVDDGIVNRLLSAGQKTKFTRHHCHRFIEVGTMIKNEHEYGVTKYWAERFSKAIASLRQNEEKKTNDPAVFPG